MSWFIRIILEVAFSIVAYLTNPIVCLFADEYGWLPKWAIWWQTEDNTLDVSWMIDEGCVPKFARYDYHKHYKYYYEYTEPDGTLVAGHVDILDPNFTFKEKVQRYICRLCWLYRNTSYGFSYYVNGVDVKAEDMVVLKNINEPHNEQFIGYERGKSLWSTAWCYYYEKPYCKWFVLRIYLGWKLKGLSNGRHMIALFFSPFRLNNED